MNQAPRLSFAPWDGPLDAVPPLGQLSCYGPGALRLWTVADSVPANAQRTPLPEVGGRDLASEHWRCFRVPYPQYGGGEASRVVVHWLGEKHTSLWVIRGIEHRPGPESTWVAWSERIHDVIRIWEEKLKGLKNPTWTAIARAWAPSDQSRQCRRSLIVRLAETLPRWLRDIARSPRVQLVRRRELRPVGRANELDGACVHWLSQRPGRTLLERAGPRQSVLSVVRQPDPGTLENRVTVDVLQRCVALARSYQQDHQAFLKEGGRLAEPVERVRRFEHLCQNLARTSALAGVTPVKDVPSPNYVLTQNTAYRAVWQAWLALRKREQERESLWEWQDRLWADLCIGLLSVLLLRLPGMREFSTSAPEIYASHAAGGFVARHCWPSPLVLDRPGLPLVRVDLDALAELPLATSVTPPDLCLRATSARGRRELYVWTAIAWHGADMNWSLEDAWLCRVQRLGDVLQAAPGAPRGLILLGSPEGMVQAQPHPQIDVLGCPFEAAGVELLLEVLGPLLEKLCGL